MSFEIPEHGKIILIGFGKASLGMARGVNELLGGRIDRGCVISKVVPEEPGFELSPVEIVRGSHPIPDMDSLQATNRLLDKLTGLQPDDLVICLISGGGSALFTKPVEGVELGDLQILTHHLLECGATIDEINILRKHLDQVKGGRLVTRTAPARLLTLVLSDVVGSPLETIASGPTVADPSTFADAFAILQKYHLVDQVPASIRHALQDGEGGVIRETVKPGDPVLEKTGVVLVGSNAVAARAALAQAELSGYHTLLLTTHLQGEARQVGIIIASLAQEIVQTGNPVPVPACVIAGGETTVTIRGRGLGGRNQEVALGAVAGLAGLPDVWMVSLATDGEDGSTSAAGAVASGSTLQRGIDLGLKPEIFLAENNSNAYFKTLGDLLVTGSTGTNVNDLIFLFVE